MPTAGPGLADRRSRALLTTNLGCKPVGRAGAIVFFQERVHTAVAPVADEGSQVDVMEAVENILPGARVGLLQRADQLFHLLPLGIKRAVCRALRQTAGTTQKFEIVVPRPGDNISFAHEIQRTDQLHARKIRAVNLRHHCFHLRAVQHAHEHRLDHVVKMMAEGNFVAAERAGVLVQTPTAHPGAEIARRFLRRSRRLKQPVFDDCDRQTEQGGVFLNPCAIFRAVAGIHHEVHQLKACGAEPLQQLHALGQQHRILAAGDAHGHAVAVAQHAVIAQAPDKFVPDRLSIFFLDAQLRAPPPIFLSFLHMDVPIPFPSLPFCAAPSANALRGMASKRRKVPNPCRASLLRLLSCLL